jgi:hypothetical protein
MLVRDMATAFALGARPVGLFTTMYGPMTSSAPYPALAFDIWQSFASDGIRNDIDWNDSVYSAATSMWPRPAWFALRRLFWLFQRASRVSVVHNELGVTVIGFEFAGGLAMLPDGSTPGSAWARGYLLWIDQYSDDRWYHPGLTGRGPAEATFHFYREMVRPTSPPYEFLPMVPAVTVTGGTDALGYAAGDPVWPDRGLDAAVVAISPRWEGPRWERAPTGTSPGSGLGSRLVPGTGLAGGVVASPAASTDALLEEVVIALTVRKTDPASGVIAPLFLFTDAPLVAVSP